MYTDSTTLRKPRILIVANPISGGGRARRLGDQLALELRDVASSVERIDTRADAAVGGHGADRAPVANGIETWLDPALARADLVVVAGGDGAIRQVAPRIADRKIALWHARAGTENLFARALGMAAGAPALRAAIAARRCASIDMGLATPRDGLMAGTDCAFLLMASCGFDAEVVHRLSEARRGAISHLSYLRPIFGACLTFRAPHLSIDDGPAVMGGVVIANGPRYAFAIDPLPGAKFDDGALQAIALPGRGGMAALAWGARCKLGYSPARALTSDAKTAMSTEGASPMAAAGSPLDSTRGSLPDSKPDSTRDSPPDSTRDSLRGRAAARFRVRSNPPSRWQLDGDAAPFGAVAQVDFRLRRRCVQVLLPATAVPPSGARTSVPTLVGTPTNWIVSSSDQEV